MKTFVVPPCDSSPNSLKHNPTVDIIRALGIIMVLISHVIFGGEGFGYLEVKIFLFSGFLVSLFFVLGGHLAAKEFEKYSVRQILLKKIKRLFVPCCAYILFYITSNFATYYGLKLFGFKPFFPHTGLKIIEFRNIVFAFFFANDARFIMAGIFGALYFISAYFTANIFFIWFLGQKWILKFAVFFAAPFAAILITHTGGSANIPWGVNIALLMLPMMVLGTYFDKIETLLVRIREKSCIFFVAGIVTIVFIVNRFKLYGGAVHNCQIENIFSFYGLAIGGFLACCGLALLIKNTILAGLFIIIGRYTLPIYGFHAFVLDHYRYFLHRFFLRTFFLDFYHHNIWIFYLVYIVLSIAGIIFITRNVLEKSKSLSFLFLGKG